MEDKKRDRIPAVRLKDSFGLGADAKKVKILTAKPIKTGESGYGPWWMWKVYVEGVVARYNDNKEIVKDYSGEAFWFPSSEFQHNKFMELTGGTIEGIEITIKKVAEETETGVRVKYVIEKVGGGEVSASSLSSMEQLLIKDISSTIAEGYDIGENDFILQSQEEIYEKKISVERAKELYKLL